MSPDEAFASVRHSMCQDDPDQITNFLSALMVMKRHPEYGAALLDAGRRWMCSDWEMMEALCDRAVRSLPIEATA